MRELRDSVPPFFFRREWAGATPLDEVMVIKRAPDGTLVVQVDVLGEDAPDGERDASLAGPGLVIYGRGVQSSYEEDEWHLSGLARRGLVFSECFSVQCEEGEVGSHPLAALTEISRDEFEAARGRGWV